MSRKKFVIEFVLTPISVSDMCCRDPVGSFEKCQGKSLGQAFTCGFMTRHPMMYSHKAREAFQERPHLYFGSPKGDPHSKQVAHTNAQKHKHKDKVNISLRQVSIGLRLARCLLRHSARGQSRVCAPKLQSQFVVPGCCLCQNVYDTSGSIGCWADCVTTTRRSHCQRPHWTIACLADPALPTTFAARIRRRSQTCQGSELSPVVKCPPGKELHHIHPGRVYANPFQLQQPQHLLHRRIP